MKRAAFFALLVVVACGAHDETEPAPGAEADAGPPPSALPQACARGPRATTTPATCNGDAALCARTYDRVTVAVTHNAMSNAEDRFDIPNQSRNLAHQLEDGIRGMMLDVHYYDASTAFTDHGRLDGVSAMDQLYLCHSSCTLGKTRLLDGLCTIVDFLDQNPGEILTLDVETYVADADLDAVLRASGLADYAYAHGPDPEAPWPTLGELIATGKRLVVFVETGGGSPDYIMPEYQGNVWDTPYDFQTADQFTCALGRGVVGSPLFLVNHWLSNPFSDIASARQVNVEAVLGKRVADCTAASPAGHPPTFVGVDFYDVGDLFSVVKKANGL